MDEKKFKETNNLDLKHKKFKCIEFLTNPKNKEKISAELLELSKDFRTNKYPSSQQKMLRHFLKDFIKHISFLSKDMLKLMYIIYKTPETYEILNKMFFSEDQDSQILMGFYKDDYKFLLDNTSIISTRGIPIENLWSNFLRQYGNNQNVMHKLIYDNIEYFFFNKKVSKIILHYYYNLKHPKIEGIGCDSLEHINDFWTPNSFLKEFSSDKKKIEAFYKLNSEVLNKLLKINMLSEFLEIVSNQPKDKDFFYDSEEFDKIDELLIPNKQISIENLYKMLNKLEGDDFTFLLSPTVSNFKFSTKNPKNIVVRTKIKIIQKESITRNEHEMILSKMYYICPGCDKKVMLEPHHFNSPLVHCCLTETTDKTKINSNALRPAVLTPIILYKCKICVNYIDVRNNNAKEKWLSDIYIFSFDDNISPSIYIGDIIKFYEPFSVLSNKNKYNYNYLLLGFKKEPIKYVEEKIIKSDVYIKQILDSSNINDSLKNQFIYLKDIIYDKKKLPKHKIWNILFSIRQYYYNRFNINIEDGGLLLQLMCLLSSIGRHCFKEKKLAISIMGTGNVSKTFPSNMIFNFVDPHYKYISDSSRLTVPALTGGINSSAIINGSVVKKFEHGAISNNGVVVFDECDKVFNNKQMQSIIKTIPLDKYYVAVIGGPEVDFNCTPVFLSNFNDFRYQYERQILEAYIVKYKSINKYENERFLKTNQDIKKYISLVNMYQNIEYYVETLNDEILANVVLSVRKEFENSRLDWKTGCQLEAMNRILFDVAIYRKNDELVVKDINQTENATEIDISENMPIQQFLEELLKYIYYEENITKINLIDVDKEYNNNSKIREQLNKLEDSIYYFLKNDVLGKNINKHFKQNADNFDKRILNLVKKTIKILQLIDDIHATELSDNVKELAGIILLKCKRGIIQKEYDLDINIKEIKSYSKLQFDFLNDIEDTKIEMYYDEKFKEEFEKLEEKSKHEMNKDDSLSDLSVKIDYDIDKKDNVMSTESEKKQKECGLKAMCVELGCLSENEEEQKEFIKKYKQQGIIYEPKSGVYKFV